MIRLNPHVLAAPVEDFVAIRRAARDPDFISLAIADPYHGPAPHVLEALHQAVREGRTRYAPLMGDPDLLTAIAAKLAAENGIAADPATDILVTHGAGHGFLVALMALLQPGDEILTTDPGFPLNFGATALLGARAVPVRLDANLEELPARLAAAITPRTRAIILHNPVNPTGQVVPEGVLRGIADIACRHNLAVLSDEVYERFIYGARPPSIATLPGMAERTVTLFGFSKDHVISGLRVGYLTADAPIVAAIGRIVQNNGVGAGAAAQRAALAALTGPQGHIDAMVQEFGQVRHEVVQRLNRIPGLSCALPEGGYFCFVDASEHGDVLALCERLLREAKVGVSPGTWCGARGAGHFRLCYGAAPGPRLMQALDRLDAFDWPAARRQSRAAGRS